jgi:hypothetical protein
VQKIAFIANGPEGSAAGVRAARIAGALEGFDVDVVFREGSRLSDARRFAAAARRAAVVYAVDLAGAPLLGALFRASSAKLIIDTGDAPSAFLRVVRARRSEVAAARLMEAYAYRSAGAFVVRGTYHPQFLREQGFAKEVHVVPDGVDLDAFRLVDGDGLREQLGLTEAFTVGVQGHFTWYPRLGGGLGWELLHAIALRSDLNLHAVLSATPCSSRSSAVLSPGPARPPPVPASPVGRSSVPRWSVAVFCSRSGAGAGRRARPVTAGRGRRSRPALPARDAGPSAISSRTRGR